MDTNEDGHSKTFSQNVNIPNKSTNIFFLSGLYRYDRPYYNNSIIDILRNMRSTNQQPIYFHFFGNVILIDQNATKINTPKIKLENIMSPRKMHVKFN